MRKEVLPEQPNAGSHRTVRDTVNGRGNEKHDDKERAWARWTRAYLGLGRWHVTFFEGK